MKTRTRIWTGAGLALLSASAFAQVISDAVIRVPAPSTLLLMGLGVAGAVAISRARRKK